MDTYFRNELLIVAMEKAELSFDACDDIETSQVSFFHFSHGMHCTADGESLCCQFTMSIFLCVPSFIHIIHIL